MPITDKRWREKIQGEVVTLLFSVVIDRELLISWAGKNVKTQNMSGIESSLTFPLKKNTKSKKKKIHMYQGVKSQK